MNMKPVQNLPGATFPFEPSTLEDPRSQFPYYWNCSRSQKRDSLQSGFLWKITCVSTLSHIPEVADSRADSHLMEQFKPWIWWPSGSVSCHVSRGLPSYSPPFLPPHLQGTKVHFLPFLYLWLQITFISMCLIVWQFSTLFKYMSSLLLQFIVRYLSSEQNLESCLPSKQNLFTQNHWK